MAREIDITLYDLYTKSLQRDWGTVVNIYKENPDTHAAKITKCGDTALHVAAVHGPPHTVAQLVDEIKNSHSHDYEGLEKTLSAKNVNGDTPLHCAASRGSLSMCKSIINVDNSLSLVHIRNNQGETPLFLAALHGHKETFLHLHYARIMTPAGSSAKPWRREGGDTILHCTLQREYFDLAFQIIHLYKGENIAIAVNERGITPLHIIASKPSAFESSTHLQWWTKLLYYCTIVKPLQIDVPPTEFQSVEINESEDKKRKLLVDEHSLPRNYRTCLDLFAFLWNVVLIVMTGGARLKTRNSDSGQNTNFPRNYATCFEFFRSSYVYIFGLLGLGLLDTRKIKEKHVWCSQIMHELVQQSTQYEYFVDGTAPLDTSEEIFSAGMKNKSKDIGSSSHDVKNGNEDQQNMQALTAIMKIGGFGDLSDWLSSISNMHSAGIMSKKNDQQREIEKRMTVLLTAAKYGVKEMVKKFLNSIPVAIHDRTIENKNILLVAVENRQPHIIELLKDHDLWDSLIQTVDNEGNNVLHLAAKVSTYKPWQIPGSAMQMQWEIKWYQFVKEIVPHHLIFQTNKTEYTPLEIFTESHEKIVGEASEWLKSTSESCSVVAALIAGVSFATSSTVPGGNNEQTGKPTLQGQPAFNVFAISSLVALCFSVTALVMFLAILTSRKQPRDFRRDLPFKLLLGLSTLFVSIASMLVSFCAAHFFVIKDKMHHVVFIIYAATCLPVSLYAVAQFPLYLDLLKTILTKVPLPSYREDDL